MAISIVEFLLAMIEMVMVLHLATHDCDTGDLLSTASKRITWLTPDRRDACRQLGVSQAQSMTNYFRAHGHANASTNVVCEWEIKDDPA